MRASLAPTTHAPLRGRSAGNVASILELDEHLNKSFKVFEAAPQEARGTPAKAPMPDYFL